MTKTQDSSLQVAVVGYGLAAKIFHIPFIQASPLLKLHSIVQRKPNKESSAPNNHPSLTHYTTLDPVLQDPAIDLVVITTPPDSHFNLSKLCLQAGKHILVEKPFVPTVEEADQLIHIARENNRLICVYQNRRWDSDFLTVKSLIKDGIFGRIYEVDTHFDYYRPEHFETWRGQLGTTDGGGALFDLGAHLIDQAYTLFGLPSSVYGVLSSQRDGRISPDKPDSVQAQLNYANGLIVNIRISDMSVESTQRRFWIRGTKGSFTKNGRDSQEAQLEAGLAPDAAGFGAEDPAYKGRLICIDENGKFQERDYHVKTPKTYGGLYEAFAEAIMSESEDAVPVPPLEAREVLRVINAIYRSAKLGQVVQV
ncbi:hypothetical protein LCI18_006172 [Fusarium solani-melongenae]|uniref:Uncharacterized protein n=1 Tax=Fusarium solani subsp. cucurbitae TaxID=2747967 RepID=A0ACD3Z206_FUSSC|nr:hypothetical protein LCI18_006172 [Fusarium solani-melongenae]